MSAVTEYVPKNNRDPNSVMQRAGRARRAVEAMHDIEIDEAGAIY